MFLDGLQFIPVLCPDLMSGHAIFLFFMNNRPALFLREAVAGFALHGDVRLAFIIVVHLLVGGYTV